MSKGLFHGWVLQVILHYWSFKCWKTTLKMYFSAVIAVEIVKTVAMFLLKHSLHFWNELNLAVPKHQWNHLQSKNIWLNLFNLLFFVQLILFIHNCWGLSSKNYYMHVKTTCLCLEKIFNFLWKYLLDQKNSGHKLFTDYQGLWRKKEVLVQASLTHSGSFYSCPIGSDDNPC